MQSIFGGKLKSVVHCKSCGHDSVTVDPALGMSLEIRDGGELATLEDCIDEFTSVEQLDQRNQ